MLQLASHKLKDKPLYYQSCILFRVPGVEGRNHRLDVLDLVVVMLIKLYFIDILCEKLTLLPYKYPSDIAVEF